MNHKMNRRRFLLAAAALPLMGVPLACAGRDAARFVQQLQQLERSFGGRIGVFALDTADGTRLTHRADERFPFCSTFKAMLAGAMFQRSSREPGLLERRIGYGRGNLVEYSPVTEKHVDGGMTVAELCAAAVQYSDNSAANLLLKQLGGPQALTAFARSIGDTRFRLDRWETELNSAIPGDPRDTTTPQAMTLSLNRLALGDVLEPALRRRYQELLLGNTTGAATIRAGVPADWRVGDKTGSGSYGTRNDVAVLWPPRRAPLVVTVYTAQHEPDAKTRNDVVAAAARIVAAWAT